MQPCVKPLAPILLSLLLAGLAGCGGGTATAPQALGSDVQLTRSWWDGTRSPLISIGVPFTQPVDGNLLLNVVVDLNGDGRFGDYVLADGSVQSEWVVRNGFANAGFPAEGGQKSFSFALADASVDQARGLRYRAVLSATRIAGDSPAASWDGTVPAVTHSVREGSIAAITRADRTIASFQPVATPPAWLPPNADADTAVGVTDAVQAARAMADQQVATAVRDDAALKNASSVSNDGVPDLKMPKGSNECVPTATANSFRWLADRHPAALANMPKTGAAIVGELKKSMLWTAEVGVLPYNVVDGKNAFLAERNLPIATEQLGEEIDPTAGDLIYKAIEQHKDVEITLIWQAIVDRPNPNGTGTRKRKETMQHMVTVVGITRGANAAGAAAWELAIHDPEDYTSQTRTYRASVTQQELVKGKPFTALTLADWGEQKLNAYVQFVYADSVVSSATTTTSTTPGTTPGTTTTTSTTPGTTTTTSTTPVTTPTTSTTPGTTTTTSTTPAVPPGQMVVSGSTSIKTTHIRTQDLCPQYLGTVIIDNPGGKAIEVFFSQNPPPPRWLQFTPAVFSSEAQSIVGFGLRIEPGGRAMVQMAFTCDLYQMGLNFGRFNLVGVDVETRRSIGGASVEIDLTVADK